MLSIVDSIFDSGLLMGYIGYYHTVKACYAIVACRAFLNVFILDFLEMYHTH